VGGRKSGSVKSSMWEKSVEKISGVWGVFVGKGGDLGSGKVTREWGNKIFWKSEELGGRIKAVENYPWVGR